MKEVFRKYGAGEERPEDKEPIACVVRHRDAGGPCRREAIGEVWGLPFCEPHGREAELAAKTEIMETVERELQVLADAERERFTTNSYVLDVFKAAKAPYEVDMSIHDAAIARAYPPDELEANTAAETLGFDYERDYVGDGPVD
jgi:hypothetical protein